MDWKTTSTRDPDTKDRLVTAGWEVYQTIPGDPTEYRLRISAPKADGEAGAALPEAQSRDPLKEIDFASDAAFELAVDKKLDAAAFQDAEPSGKTGFTKADVEVLVGAE